jgi:hypothetical protein
MEVLLMAVMALANILCFLIGAKVGQKVSKGEEVELPTANPIEAIREHREKKEYDHKQSQLETILRNIDNYNGTEYGQEEVPRG